jgi:hypothetical protein
MNPEPANSSEAMEQKAKVCATVAEDIIEESLTGESSEKEKNEAEARIWQQKSEGLLKAAAKASAGSSEQPPP